LHAEQVDSLGLDADSDEDGGMASTDDAPDSISRPELLGEEFDACYKRYKKKFAALNWKEAFPEVWETAADDGKEVDFPFDLWAVDMSGCFETFKIEDPDKKLYGHLPMMAIGSVGSIGAFLASSFCERINSAANLVVTDGNSLLATDEIDMLVCLRMNREYMKFMRKNHQQD
jgi:hypothetical protein